MVTLRAKLKNKGNLWKTQYKIIGQPSEKKLGKTLENRGQLQKTPWKIAKFSRSRISYFKIQEFSNKFFPKFFSAFRYFTKFFHVIQKTKTEFFQFLEFPQVSKVLHLVGFHGFPYFSIALLHRCRIENQKYFTFYTSIIPVRLCG